VGNEAVRDSSEGRGGKRQAKTLTVENKGSEGIQRKGESTECRRHTNAKYLTLCLTGKKYESVISRKKEKLVKKRKKEHQAGQRREANVARTSGLIKKL